MNTATRAAIPAGFAARLAAWAFGIAAVLVLAVGFLHTAPGRGVLSAIGVGCPARAGTPEEVDRARAVGVARHAGRTGSPARPALVFALERTTIADLEAWADAHRVSCSAIRGTDTLRKCTDVPAAAVGQPAWFAPIEELTFEFRADRTLASVSTMRRKLAVADANAMTRELGRQLNDLLGAPTVHGGQNDPAHFAKSPLQAYKEEWVFGDYGATLGEVRLADTGLMVREQYISAVP
jgi:hypothetical protein